MLFPAAFSPFNLREVRGKRGVARATGKESELNGFFCMKHVKHAHHAEILPVNRIFEEEVAASSAQTVIHGLGDAIEVNHGPVRKTIVCDDREQLLETVVLIFDATFHPVVFILIDEQAALVEVNA